MYIKLNLQSEFEISSLSDLPKFKEVMESLKMNINKNQQQIVKTSIETFRIFI